MRVNGTTAANEATHPGQTAGKPVRAWHAITAFLLVLVLGSVLFVKVIASEAAGDGTYQDSDNDVCLVRKQQLFLA